MSPFDSADDRDAEDREWADSLSDEAVEALLRWLADDPACSGQMAGWPDWLRNRVVKAACRVCGEAARRREGVSVFGDLERMLAAPNTVALALNVVAGWKSPRAVPLLRRLAATADRTTVKLIADGLVEIKHPDAIGLYHALIEQHRPDQQLCDYLQFALAENRA